MNGMNYNEERHTEARATWSFLFSILYPSVCTTLIEHTLSLSNLINAKTTHSLGKCTNILDFKTLLHADTLLKVTYARCNVYFRKCILKMSTRKRTMCLGSISLHQVANEIVHFCETFKQNCN